jgi:hypothetical protein
VAGSNPTATRAIPVFCQLRDGTRFSVTFPGGHGVLRAYVRLLDELRDPSDDFLVFMDDGLVRKSDVVAVWIGSQYVAWTGENERHLLDG